MSSQSVLRFPLADCYSLSGWHGVELDPRHGPFRWSGPAPVSRLVLPITPIKVDGPLSFNVQIIHQVNARALNGCRVLINGHEARAAVHALTGAFELSHAAGIGVGAYAGVGRSAHELV